MPGFAIPTPTKSCPPTTTQLDGPQHTTETARKHRYLLEVLEPFSTDAIASPATPDSASYVSGSFVDAVPRQTGSSLLVYLKKATRPAIEVDEIAFHSGQDEIFRPGKQHWRPIEFTFYEKVDGSENGTLVNTAARRMFRWWAERMINISTSSHNQPGHYMADAQLNMLDGNGNPIWRYFIYDCWPSKISPCDLSYADTDIGEITVTMRYSKARETQ